MLLSQTKENFLISLTSSGCVSVHQPMHVDSGEFKTLLPPPKAKSFNLLSDTSGGQNKQIGSPSSFPPLLSSNTHTHTQIPFRAPCHPPPHHRTWHHCLERVTLTLSRLMKWGCDCKVGDSNHVGGRLGEILKLYQNRIWSHLTSFVKPATESSMGWRQRAGRICFDVCGFYM